MRMAALALICASTPLAAETWDCRMITLCSTFGDHCETDEDGMTGMLTLAPDGQGGTFLGSPGTEDEVRLTLHRIGGTADSRTYQADPVKGSIAFLSIFQNGTLLTSAHENNAVNTWVSALEGECKRLDS